MNKTIVVAFLLGGLSLTAASQEDSSATWRLFPSPRVFPKFSADPTAPGISLNKDLRTRLWLGGIGGLSPILQWSHDDVTVQVGIGASVFMSMNRKPRILEVLTADFYVYIPLDIQVGKRLVFRTGYGHFSAHLADDGIEILGLHSINYAKDHIPALCVYKLPEIGGFVYGGVRIDYYTIPEKNRHFVLQTGGEAGNWRLTNWMSAYAALDLRFKSENGWATTQSYQAGVKISSFPAGALRIAFTVRTGIDDRGQFYQSRLTTLLFGVYLDV